MKFLLQKAKTYGDAQLALTPVTKSFGAVTAEYENVNIAVLYFKTYQLTGVMNQKISDFVKDLEQMNLYIHAQNPKAAFSIDDRKKLLAIIDAPQNDVSEHINKKKI